MNEIGAVLVRVVERVGWITLNRPQGYNAIKGEMITSLHAALDWAASEDLRALVITGSGGYFCAGGDLRQFKSGWEENARREPAEAFTGVSDMLSELARLAARLRLFPWPVIASVNGAATGGGFGLAMACDLRIVARGVPFQVGYQLVGASAATLGVTHSMPRLLGSALALELMVTTRTLSADEAMHYGLVNRVADAADIDEQAQAFGAEIASMPPLSVRTSKAAMYRHLESTYEQALAHETLLQTRCLLSRDHYEGVVAKLEKRAPVFRDC